MGVLLLSVASCDYRCKEGNGKPILKTTEIERADLLANILSKPNGRSLSAEFVTCGRCGLRELFDNKTRALYPSIEN